MYVVRVYQGAVCFKKETYYDFDDAVMAFSCLLDNIFTHITLEIFREFSTETWIRTAPFPTHWEGSDIWKGGEKNE